MRQRTTENGPQAAESVVSLSVVCMLFASVVYILCHARVA
jgi:hypothetical protein